MGLAALPPELLHVAFEHLKSTRDLCALAGTCVLLRDLTDEWARIHCGTRRGLWAEGHSWRVQLVGRSYRAGQKLTRQYGSAGTRRSLTQRTFTSPTAISAIGGHIVAVADASQRKVLLFDLASGQVVRSVDVDGIPTAARLIPLELVKADVCAHHGAEAGLSGMLCIVLQGELESGEAIPGVHDRRHRLQCIPLQLDDRGQPPVVALGNELAAPAPAAWSTPGLSYPNGTCILSGVQDGVLTPYVCCANWNGNSCFCVPIGHLVKGSPQPDDGMYVADGYLHETVVPGSYSRYERRGFDRPFVSRQHSPR